jgi:exodeoxyribonuclease V alpha subunit
MGTHLAARLVWHDHGWDGRICRSPKGNGWCIRYEWVHEGRKDDEEAKRAGDPIKDDFIPPCVHDANAFGRSTYSFQHKDPLFRKFLSPTTQTLEPYSFVTAPFRRMREEQGWIYDPEEQKKLLDDFYGALEEKHSLVFFYGMHGNPIDDDSDRVLLGVGRITEVDTQQYFGGADTEGQT